MYRWIVTAALAAALGALILAAGCTESQRKDIKHMKSDLVGLKRTVTLYDCQGRTIKTWTGRFKVEMSGGVATFIDDDGKEVKVAGTYVIEEVN